MIYVTYMNVFVNNALSIWVEDFLRNFDRLISYWLADSVG